MSELEINRLRGFYGGLSEALEKTHKHAKEAHEVADGLLSLCQEHLTILGELEQQNADLRRENRNFRLRMGEPSKEKLVCNS